MKLGWLIAAFAASLTLWALFICAVAEFAKALIY